VAVASAGPHINDLYLTPDNHAITDTINKMFCKYSKDDDDDYGTVKATLHLRHGIISERHHIFTLKLIYGLPKADRVRLSSIGYHFVKRICHTP